MNEYATRYYLMLDHALKINAKEQFQNLIVSMAPHMKPDERKRIINTYNSIINEKKEESKYSDDIIKEDRKRLKQLLFNKK